MRKKSMQCLIVADNGYDYVVGGTFRIAGTKYAKLTSNRSEAKRYSSKSKAVEAGKKLAKSCHNLNGKFIVLEEDGFQGWQYSV